jgi:hypothetical protein
MCRAAVRTGQEHRRFGQVGCEVACSRAWLRNVGVFNLQLGTAGRTRRLLDRRANLKPRSHALATSIDGIYQRLREDGLLNSPLNLMAWILIAITPRASG